jgi:hypothetical protein
MIAITISDSSYIWVSDSVPIIAVIHRREYAAIADEQVARMRVRVEKPSS